MRYLPKCVRRIGLVSTLLIGGVLGGLTAPLPSEAATLTIDGVNIPLLDTVGTGAGQKYTCESGYTSCWYLTSSPTATRTITGNTGNWTIANITTGNRARVRINDVGGTPATNVDKMNLTGIILTPATASAKTTHIIITHTYNNGQGVGNYQWGMTATGHFDPIGTETPLKNKFILSGKGKFKTTTTSDPEKDLGKLDLGPVDSNPPLAPGQNGIVSQTVNVTSVKTGCNTLGGGSCKPEIKYDYEIYIEGRDSLVLVDSMLGAGITCTDAELDPDIPPILLFLMRLVDPHGVLPTKISGLNGWIDDMAEKYKLNTKQLAKVEKVKVALAKWLLGQTCAGKVQQVLNADAASGIAAGVAAGGRLMTTCSATNTCGTGTIVIKKTVNPDIIENFGFTGTGSGIGDFGIRTDEDVCNDGCMGGSQTFTLLQTGPAGGSRTITETGLPIGWHTDDVSCTNSGGENTTAWTTYYGATSFAYVTVSNLEAGDTLTCTFHNVADYYNVD